MALIDECYSQLENAIANWDFTGWFPPSWPTKGVLITNKWPVDLIDNMLKEDATGGVMPKPIISIVHGEYDLAWASFGNRVPNLSKVTGKPLKGFRAGMKFIISAWADEALGGEVMVTNLAGEIVNCLVWNANSLPSFRHLRAAGADTAYEDKPLLWVSEVHVEGTAIVNYEDPGP